MTYNENSDILKQIVDAKLDEYPILINFNDINDTDYHQRHFKWREYHKFCEENNIKFDWIGGRFKYQIAVRTYEDYLLIKLYFDKADIDPASKFDFDSV